jgi:quercetin dioxygenase-like cupin family protein
MSDNAAQRSPRASPAFAAIDIFLFSSGLPMQLKHSAIPLAIVLSFGAGIAASPFVPGAIQAAHAATAPMMPQVIDVGAMTYENLPPQANSKQRSVTLVSTPNGTIAVQAGLVGKHTHQLSEEVQYILEGSGTMWVGNERKDFKPGTLIIIPRNTPHGGANVPYKALAIKLPPAVAGDSQYID